MKKLLALLLFLAITGFLAFDFYNHWLPQENPALTPRTALTVRNLDCPIKDLSGEQFDFMLALEESLEFYQSHPEDTFIFGPQSYSANTLIEGYQRILDFLQEHNMDSAAFIEFICAEFIFFNANSPYVRVTGYFEPILAGSLTPSEQYPYPIYKTPPDLIESKPYLNRSEIDSDKKLAGKGLELAWVSDKIDLFFLHIQGSGTIQLPDGEELRVGYAANNGHPYRAIGSILIREGHLEKVDVSMQSIKKFLRDNPTEQERILNHNKRYIFFRELESVSGPIGAIGQALTPFHSIASDLSLFPKGALALLSVTLPSPAEQSREQSFLVLNQDTGSAIKSANRADFFLGSSEQGEYMAGYMNTPGSLLFLAPSK